MDFEQAMMSSKLLVWFSENMEELNKALSTLAQKTAQSIGKKDIQ